MFFAAMNNAVCGYDFRLVAFESKKRRDMMTAATSFHAVNAKEAKNHAAYETCRDYPESIFDENKKMKGIVAFTYKGDFHSIM